MHMCLDQPEILQHISHVGGIWASVPMRGVCRAWRSAVTTTVDASSAETIVALLKTNGCKRKCWPRGTRSDLCKVMALPLNVFMQLNPKRLHPPAYYKTLDVLQRTIKYNGGLWALLSRHHQRTHGKRLRKVDFDLPPSRKDATTKVSDILTAYGYDKNLCKRVLHLMRHVP